MFKLHEELMEATINYAKKHNPVWPFAAILVDDKGSIQAYGINNANISPVLHGEIAVINNFCNSNQPQYLANMTLYTTAEPCPMCMAAIYWSGIKTIVYGSGIPFLNGIWKTQIEIRAAELLNKTPHGYAKTTQLVGPVLEVKCNQLFLHAHSLQQNQQDELTPNLNHTFHTQ